MTTSDAAFTAATHSELARLIKEAAAARRAHNRPGCICVNCTRLARIHDEINDHLDQLEGAPQPADRAALAIAFATPTDTSRIQAAICSCGERRYVAGGDFLACIDCDEA